MPRLTEQTARERRQRIIDAALRCFARDGLHHTSMADLFEEAGTSAGSVYSWFASKDDIIEAAYRGSGTPSAVQMASTLDGGDPAAAIAQVLRTAAAMFDDERWQMTSRVNIQLWGEALVNNRVRDRFLDDFRTYRRLLAGAVEHAQQQHQFDPALDADVVAQVLWGLYLGMEVQSAWEPELDTHAYVETAIALALR